MSSLQYETVVPRGTSFSQGIATGVSTQKLRETQIGGLASLINKGTQALHGAAVAHALKQRLENLESEIEKQAINGNGVLVVATYKRAKVQDPALATRSILSVIIAGTGKDKQSTLSKWLSTDRLSQGPGEGWVVDGSDYLWVTRGVWPASPYSPAVAERDKYVATITVQSGNTLGQLCKQVYPQLCGEQLRQRVEMVAKANGISNANMIRVGQKINFPKV